MTLDLGLSDRIVDVVEEGWDIVICTEASFLPLFSSGCPWYLAERGTPRAISELSAHNCLGYTLARTLGPGRWVFGKDGGIVVPIKGEYCRRTTATRSSRQRRQATD